MALGLFRMSPRTPEPTAEDLNRASDYQSPSGSGNLDFARLMEVRLLRSMEPYQSPDGRSTSDTVSSQVAVSSHRSPPYASKSPELVPRMPSTTGGPLTLTIKSSSNPKVTSKVVDFVDPSPDWTLEDLQKELDVIASRYRVPVTLDNQPPLKKGISWRELSVTADFGRKSGTFQMRAFDTDSDSDEEEDSAVTTTSGRNLDLSIESTKVDGADTPSDLKEEAAVARQDLWGSSPLLAHTGHVEAALLELESERHNRVQEEFRKRRSNLDTALREEVQREVALLARVERDKEAKCELARRSDKQDQRQIAELRDVHLSALQRDHELRSQFEARQIRKEAAEEELRRQEIAAREERERQMKARLEAEAKRKADAEKGKAEAEVAKRKAQADAAASAALQRAEADKESKEIVHRTINEESQTKQHSGRTTTGWKPRIAPTAAKLEEAHLLKLRELQDASTPLQANPGNQKELKTLERLIIKHLQQIAATQEQVNTKSMDLLQLLSDPRVPTQLLTVTLGAKLLSQCESQVLKLPSFAFALAQVIVNVASKVPHVMDIVLAKLHEACIFTVPKYYVFSKDQFESDVAYYRALGYREEDGKLESTDDYVTRMTAYMTFYGAMVQTDVSGGQNPHGLAAGWAWCARLLNNIPANRSSASALEAFLKMAGFRLYQVYPKPFMKVMQTVVSEFIEKLKTSADQDVRAVVSRLETYLHHQKYLKEPDGRKMPLRDMSSSLKA